MGSINPCEETAITQNRDRTSSSTNYLRGNRKKIERTKREACIGLGYPEVHSYKLMPKRKQVPLRRSGKIPRVLTLAKPRWIEHSIP